MTRRTWAAVAAAALTATAVVALLVVAGGDEAAPAATEQVTTGTVVRGPLSSSVSQAGTLTYRAGADGSPVVVVNRATGTFTQLPDGGAQVGCGQVLFRVDDDPVVLLCGTVPAYRDLRRGDAGPDVRQLNQNLHQLGVDAGIGVDPADDVFTTSTEAALEVLQERLGVDATGVLAADDAVFLPWSIRVAELAAPLGGLAQPGSQVLTATSDTLEVHVELDSSQQEAVRAGDVARITLPGHASATGKVERLGRIAKAPVGPGVEVGSATIGAYVTLDHPEAVAGLDKAPVQVAITTTGVDDALSVPVTAIVGRSGGGFAVEAVRPDGQRRLVTVRLGLFDTAGGRVQVEGDLRAGDRVVVPSP